MNQELIRVILRAWLKCDDTIGFIEVIETIEEELGHLMPAELVKLIESEFDPQNAFVGDDSFPMVV